MATVLLTSLACFALGLIFIKASASRKNHTIAQTSGFPVFYSPVHVADWWWLILYPLLVPFLKLLPRAWKNPWLQMAQIWNIWKVGHRPFEEVGSDSFMLATPSGNMLWTCDPSVVNALFTQHSKSHAAVDMLKFFDIWGPTVGSVEGDEWRAHRKIIASGFNPTTNTNVWKEAIHQSQTLVDRWIEEGSVIPVVRKWTSRLALHVLSGAFFNKRLDWKEYTDDTEPVPMGHRISYENALFTVLARLGTLFITPRMLLGKLPGKFFKEPYIAFIEWTKYMQELRDEALSQLEEISVKKNKNMLESIVVAGTPGPTRPGNRPLPEESLLGNIFFIMLAGHETAGNTMAFTLLLLTLYPEYQHLVQDALDQQLGSRSSEEWTLEEDYQALHKGYVGAVQKEVMRLYHVAQYTLRRIVAPMTVLDSKGKTHLIPEGTLCLINFAAAYQNPATWPQRKVSSERRAELHDSPAMYFDPSRWLDNSNEAASKDADTDTGVSVYWPFGLGPRSCLGRAFAQIEMTAFVAKLFKDYSLELVVDEEMVRACDGDEKVAWERTRDKAFRMLIDDMEANISIQMVKDLPIRVVTRSSPE